MGRDDGASRPFGMIPDILLDEDRLNMLLDIVCADYITACYASHENGKRVVLQALEKLSISVHANVPRTGTSSSSSTSSTAACSTHYVVLRPAQDAQFQERARRFYQDLLMAFAARQQAGDAGLEAPTAVSSLVTSSLSRGLDESVVREVMKPRLLQIVEEMCRDRDRQLLLNSEVAALTGSTVAASAAALAAAEETGGVGETEMAAAAVATLLPPTSSEIRMEGWLRKKGQHVNLWRERYFMIRSTLHGTHFLCYLRKKGDKEPRGWYVLGPGTTVDEVRESPSKIETKRLFTFRIRHLNYATNDEVSDECGGGVELTARTTPSRPANEFQLSLLDTTIGSHEAEFDARASVRRASSRKLRNRAAAAAAAATAATAVVLTGGLAGVGIGMMGMSMSAAAAASAGAAGAMIAQSRSKGPIALAAESLETAVWWRNSILECIAQAEEQWKRYLNWYMDHETDMDEVCSTFLPENKQQGSTAPTSGVRRGRSMSLYSYGKAGPLARYSESRQQAGLLAPQMGSRQRSGSFGSMPRSIAKSFRTSATFSQETSWQLYEFSDKLRVDTERLSHQSSLRTSAPPPALRTSLKVNASPRKVFEMLMKLNSPFYSSNHVIEDARILEEHAEDHSDVVYWKLFSTYLWPVSVSARELCLLRYWRMEPDGSYFICYQSTTHTDCPYSSGAVRANILGGGFIISPRVQEDSDNHFDECWVTLAIQMNPNGWIDWRLARSWYYVHAYGVFFLEMITATTAAEGMQTMRPETAVSNRHREKDGGSPSAPSQQIVTETKFSMLDRYRTDLNVQHGLPTKFWSEPSAAGFMVRGPQYLTSRAKVPSARQVFRLVNVELFKSNEAIEHIGVSSFVKDEFDHLDASNPAVEDRPFIFIINFMLPGPPHHSLVLYFAVVDPLELQKNSVFADLCHDVLRGPDDELRTQRIKLIPRVVQGTWSIREGVGTTPAILGTKVYQEYYRGKNYLEVDYDIGSSIVATGILNMLLGYSRDLIIDLAFVIEAQSVLELPERVLGTVRLDCIDLSHAVPFTKEMSKSKKN
uniref:START domain-containing protein n=1 Tax=Hyaloperonospora arabidopsidis (strain Emoy2) TaxID=559515 RepID=M4BK07_HYAAE